MPPAKKRKSPIDRFTDASPSAISAGFSAAMNLGPQPKGFGRPITSTAGLGELEGVSSTPSGSTGASWLQSLQDASGVRGDFPGSEDEGSDVEPTSGAGKKAKKTSSKRKKPNSGDEPRNLTDSLSLGLGVDEDEAAQHRKAQNRIAQREFRQRKQQYVRALEARVELLSSDHDTQVDRLRHALRGLLAENNTLRSMLGSFARFIGEGMLGGPLQQNGMTRDQLIEIINGRSEKTMTEEWQNWPGAKECEALRQLRQEANIPVEGLPDMQQGSPHPGNGEEAADSGKTSKESKRKPSGKTGTSGAPVAATNAVSSNASTPASNNGNIFTPEQSNQQPNGSPQAAGSAAQNTERSDSSSNNPPQSSNTTQPNTSVFPLAAAPMPMPAFPPSSMPGQTMEFGAINVSAPPNPSFSPFNLLGNGDNAVLASLFGPDSLYSGNPLPAGITPALPANQAFFGQPAPDQPSLQAMNGYHGLSDIGSGHQTLDNSSSSTSSPASHSTPMTAFHNSVQLFLQSLREMDARTDGMQRVRAMAQHMNALRASQRPAHDFNGARQDPETSAGELLPLVGSQPQSEEDVERMTSACVSMCYHMNAYRRNSSYCLPPLLRPTQLQLSRPHDPLIDGIPFAGLRNSLILAADRVNLDEVLFHLLCATRIGEGGDEMQEETWELDHSFVLRFPTLATEDVLNATNRWRRSMAKLAPLSREDLIALAGESINNDHDAIALKTLSFRPTDQRPSS